MQNFQDTFETCKQSLISLFSICMTVPLNMLQVILALNKKASSRIVLFFQAGIEYVLKRNITATLKDQMPEKNL